MENKNVGWLIVGITAVLVIIIFIFNNALSDIVQQSCTMVGHGDTCPMYDTITQQTILALAIAGVLLLIGIFLLFSKTPERIIVQEVEKEVIPKDTSELKAEEKEVYELIKNNHAIFQAELIEKTGYGKAKMTRILDRLEGQGYIERKRRGMTNVVVEKE